MLSYDHPSEDTNVQSQDGSWTVARGAEVTPEEEQTSPVPAVVAYPDPVTPLPAGPVASVVANPVTPLPLATAGQMIAPSTRPPLIIPGSGEKSLSIRPPAPRRKRMVVHASVAALCVCILLGVLLSVVPAGGDGHASALSQLFHPVSHMSSEQDSNTALIASQAATATAVSQYDGFDPGGAGSGGGSGLISTSASDAAHLGRFYYGQCTYWANYRYHQLTGTWVPWLGDAYEWYANAIAAGWHTSTSPNPNGPSIIVLGPYAQGSYSYYGHVGVVESPQNINSNGTVLTSNWHYPYLATLSYVTFQFPAAGTHFIWAP